MSEDASRSANLPNARRSSARHLTVAPVRTPARFGDQRAVHFIDIENMCGTASFKIFEAQAAMGAYHRAIGIAVGDHVIIGASHHNLVAAGYAWPGARLLAPQSGPNGADRALRHAMRTESFGERFAAAYLGSGDGGFAEDLAYLASCGMATHVISRSNQLSRRLRLAAQFTTIIPTK